MKFTKKFAIALLVVLTTLVVIPTAIPVFESTYTVEAASKVKINAKKKTLNVNQKYKLKISGTKKKVRWTSSNKKIATVTSKGLVKAKKKGKVTITAKVGKKKYTCKVKVENPKISRTSKTLSKGDASRLRITGSTQKIRWTSSNKKIATVTSKGLVKAKKRGKVTITAKVGGTKYRCKVTVNYNKQALKKAKELLDSKFYICSYSNLYEMVKSFGFTSSESKYAVDNCKANWNTQATISAQIIAENTGFSKEDTFKDLIKEGFTKKQAKYGIEHCKFNWK